MFLLLLNGVIIAFSVGCLKKVLAIDLLKHVLILEIACAAFNLLLGLVFFFDFMEHNNEPFLKELIGQSSQLIWMILFATMVIIHTVVCIRIFIVNKKLKTQ
ncbi:MAG: hypothetical protein IPJ20_05415 [Flammeovirgaceae bacterium]|nr:hypothetical protein [Flammeovirgaceae bacterium]